MSGPRNTNHYCSVPKCGSWAKRSSCKDISFHCFPRENERKVRVQTKLGLEESIDRRRAWINALKIKKPVSKYMKVCSLHFTEEDYFRHRISARKILKKNSVPSQNLPKTAIQEKNEKQNIQRELRRQKRSIKDREEPVTQSGLARICQKIEIFDADNKCIEVITEELNTKCRTCIRNDGLINVFTGKHKEVSLNEIIGMFSLATVNVSDGLPQKICGRCAKTLVEFYSFKQQTEQVQLMLQMAAGQLSLPKRPKPLNTSIEEDNVQSDHDESSDYIIKNKVTSVVNNSDKTIALETRNNELETSVDDNIVEIIDLTKVNEIDTYSNNKYHSSTQVYICTDCQVPFKEYADYASHRKKVLAKQNKERNQKNKPVEGIDTKLDIPPTELVEIEIGEGNGDFLLEHAYSKPQDDHQSQKTNLKSKCVVCSLEFDTLADYLKHKQENARRHLILCTLCNKRVLPSKIEQHKQLHAQTKCRMSTMLVDPETGKFSCSVCDVKFDSRLRYLLHKRCRSKRDNSVMSKQPKQKHPCPICGVQYGASILDDHINTHTKEQPYMCEICGKKFRFKSNFLSHKHVQSLCDLCGAILSSSGGLRKHIKMKHSIASLACDTCHKMFNNKNQLEIHKRAHTGERPYLCTICGKTFTQATHLRTHMKGVHSRKKPFYCSKCKRYVDNEDHHTCDGKGELYKRCTTCHGFVLDMDTHMNLHIDGHDYICGFCNQTFTEKSKLKSHKSSRVCRRKYEYGCDVCYKQFHSKSLLKIHIRSHTGERPYKCETCGKRFLQFAHLNYHLKLHTGEKHYECPYCGKRFVLNGNLTQHIRMHTGEKPHVCDYCFKGFPTSSSMKKHRLVHMKYKM